MGWLPTCANDCSRRAREAQTDFVDVVAVIVEDGFRGLSGGASGGGGGGGSSDADSDAIAW